MQDNVDVSFESILDLSAFTIRIPQADCERLPDILAAVPESRRLEMQRNLANVWQRFTYSSYRPFAKLFREEQARNAASAATAPAAAAGDAEPLSLPATVPDLDPTADDAFSTIMQWLHSRIDATR